MRGRQTTVLDVEYHSQLTLYGPAQIFSLSLHQTSSAVMFSFPTQKTELEVAIQTTRTHQTSQRDRSQRCD